MGYTQRQDASNHDSITTFDSPTLAAGTYTASASLGCVSELVALLSAIKGAGAFVQGIASASASGGSDTVALTFPTANTSGNCIIVDASMSGLFGPGATNATCADSQGNTYTQIAANAVSGGNLIGFTFAAFGVKPGANTVTVTFVPGLGDSPGPVTLAINEYVGGSAVDSVTGAAGTGGPVFNMSLATTLPGDLLHLVIFISNACTGSPFDVTGGIPEDWLIVNEPSLGLTDRSSFLFMGDGQHSFDLKLRERGTANYTLVSDPFNPDPARRGAPSTYEPTMGQPIYLFDQNASGFTLEFAGLIQDYTIRWVGNQGLRYIDVSAVSLESVFDTVYVEEAMQFVNQTCGAILTVLFDAFENGCPVSLGLIQAGVTIPLFNAEKTTKLSDIFDQLATTSEFTWGVNPQTQQLFFQSPTAVAAPFEIQSANVLWDSISQKFDNADYRNRQAVKLSFDAFTHSEEYFVGAGTTGPFTLMRPLEQGVNAYVTTATPNTATASFSGQPSPGDTITVGPADGAWQGPSHIYALGGYIVVSGFVFQVTTAGTSGLTEPNFLAFPVLGDTVVDNSVIWTNQGTTATGSIFTSYEFVTALDNTQFGQILIGGTLAATVQNTVDALNAAAPYGGTPATNGKGLTISLPTWENSQVNAITVTGTGFTVTQKIPGSGNIAALTSTGTHFAWSTPNTTGGTSPQTSVGLNEGAWISIAIYAAGTSTSAPAVIYTPGSAIVTLATPLNVGTNLVVEYTRTDGNVIEVENTASVAALAAISHGTGKYQQVTDQSSTGLIATSAAAGLQFAQQILATFDVTQQKFSVDFYQPGIFPGQVLTFALNSPLDVMNGSYLVLSIKGQLVPTYPYLDNPNAPNAGHYKYTADLINVNLIGTDLAWWLGLGGGGSGGGSGTAGALVATSGSTGQTGGTGPGGSSPQVQYNTGAALGGITGATSDGTNLLVTTQPPGDATAKAASTAFVAAATGSGGLGSSVTLVFDETPAGTVNGSNTSFTLANAPNPAASLQLFQNGVLAIQGTDYTLSGLTITFTSAPSTGAILTAFYRYGAVTGNYVDDETPSGAVNGSNVTFTLAHSPSPASSLRLFDNGVLQIQGTDYTIAGTTITMSSAPTTGDQLIAYYIYGASVTNYSDNETPSGTVNGSNVTFGLAHMPNPAASLNLYVNGVLQLFGADFTLATATITMSNAPSTGAILTAFYRY